jgi:ATP-dependent Lon protease
MSEIQQLPVIPLREAVLFPGVTSPIAAGRPGTLRAIEAALKRDDKTIFVLTQRENLEDVTPEILHTLGTIATIGPVQRGPSGMRLLLNGVRRGVAARFDEADGYLEAAVRTAEEIPPLDTASPTFEALFRETRERAAELGRRAGLPKEAVQQFLAENTEPGNFADMVSGHLDLKSHEAQKLLETLSVEDRLRQVLISIQRQVSVLDAQEEIKSQVQEELGDRQREMFLRQQLKAIQKELGEDGGREDLEELREKLEELELPAEARKEVERELGRLERMGPEGMEAQVIRTYLETITELPWTERSDERLDVKRAAEILDEDHYALGDVKDRILEFLSVRLLRQLRDDAEEAANAGTPDEHEPPTEEVSSTATPPAGDSVGRNPILLFGGPPGVGKTSVAKSIARSPWAAKYVRISLGGVRDEADIRGHRRTYVGAMPGRIIQGMKQAGAKQSRVPARRGGQAGRVLCRAIHRVSPPRSAGPCSEQRRSWTTTWAIPFDLSEVLFICHGELSWTRTSPAPLQGPDGGGGVQPATRRRRSWRSRAATS